MQFCEVVRLRKKRNGSYVLPIPAYIRKTTGLEDGSEVFLILHEDRAEGGEDAGVVYRIIASPMNPELFSALFRLTVALSDEVGSLARSAEVFRKLGLNILTSASRTYCRRIGAVWDLLVSSSDLRGKFQRDGAHAESCYWEQRQSVWGRIRDALGEDRIAENKLNLAQLNEYAVAHSELVRHLPLDDIKKTIADGRMELPSAFVSKILETYRRIHPHSRYDFHHAIIVADMDTGILSVTLPEPSERIARIELCMRDSPGTLAQVTQCLADRNVNLLESTSYLLASGRTSRWRAIADVAKAGGVGPIRRALADPAFTGLFSSPPAVELFESTSLWWPTWLKRIRRNWASLAVIGVASGLALAAYALRHKPEIEALLYLFSVVAALRGTFGLGRRLGQKE